MKNDSPNPNPDRQMQIRISKHDLSKALNTVSTTLGKAGGDDLSSHFVFRVGSDLEILTNTGTIWSGVRVPAAKFEEPDSTVQFTVEGTRLLQWVRAVKKTNTIEITFDDETKVVVVEDERGQQHFRSLDPADFPFWDSMLAEAETTATVPADQLRTALNYVKTYVADDVTKTPHLCVSEVRGGDLFSCDGGAAAVVRIEGLASCKIRVSGPHIGAITKFLDSFSDGEVEIREGKRAYFIVAGDAVLGENRFSAEFPAVIKADWDVDVSYQWGMQADEVKDAILWLTAGASHEENRIYFDFDPEGEYLKMSMKALTGKKVSLNVRAFGFEKLEDAPDLPVGGAGVPYAYLKHFVDKRGDDTVWFALTPNVDDREGKKFVSRGTLQTTEEVGTSRFKTTVIWNA